MEKKLNKLNYIQSWNNSNIQDRSDIISKFLDKIPLQYWDFNWIEHTHTQLPLFIKFLLKESYK